ALPHPPTPAPSPSPQGEGEESAATSKLDSTPTSPMLSLLGNAPCRAVREQGSNSPIDTPTGDPLGIICGAGTVPFAVADVVTQRGRPVVLFPLRGWADATAVQAYSHHWVWLGQFGRICRLARQEGCREMVFVGGLVRPSIWQLRLDLGT